MKLNKIAVFDSGVGGLATLKLLEDSKICNEIIYYADNANIPFGDKTQKELIKICQNAVDFLNTLNVDLIIFACNTASSVVKYLKSSIKIIPITDYAKLGLNVILNSDKLLVVATEATINSNIYQEECNKLNIKADFIYPKEFVNLIEKMEFKMTKKYFKTYFINTDYKYVLLGCTHYPFLREYFEEYFPNSILIDPSVLLIKDLLKYQQSDIKNTLLTFKASKNINILINFYKRIGNAQNTSKTLWGIWNKLLYS